MPVFDFAACRFGCSEHDQHALGVHHVWQYWLALLWVSLSIERGAAISLRMLGLSKAFWRGSVYHNTIGREWC